MKNAGYESTLAWLVMHHDAVLRALQSLVAQYGRGDIMFYDAARQRITCRLQYGVTHYTFRVHHLKNGRVSIGMRGHRVRVSLMKGV